MGWPWSVDTSCHSSIIRPAAAVDGRIPARYLLDLLLEPCYTSAPKEKQRGQPVSETLSGGFREPQTDLLHFLGGDREVHTTFEMPLCGNWEDPPTPARRGSEGTPWTPPEPASSALRPVLRPRVVLRHAPHPCSAVPPTGMSRMGAVDGLELGSLRGGGSYGWLARVLMRPEMEVKEVSALSAGTVLARPTPPTKTAALGC